MAAAGDAIGTEITAAGLDPGLASDRLECPSAGLASKPGKEFCQLFGADLENPDFRLLAHLVQATAITRAGPPVPLRCFGAPTKSVAPEAGNWSRFARFSTPNLPDGSHE